MTSAFEKDYRVTNNEIFKYSVASTSLTKGETHLALFIFTLMRLLVPTFHSI
jgi:hypothetical protein